MNQYLYLVVIGFIMGLVARIIMPGRDPMGLVMTTVLGVVGSAIGFWGASYLGLNVHGEYLPLLVALVGSLALLSVFKFVRNV
jgi:uncharacterized membrane protein YeaQ/YmgE (transglycosylase-associated protein family)